MVEKKISLVEAVEETFWNQSESALVYRRR